MSYVWFWFWSNVVKTLISCTPFGNGKHTIYVWWIWGWLIIVLPTLMGISWGFFFGEWLHNDTTINGIIRNNTDPKSQHEKTKPIPSGNQTWLGNPRHTWSCSWKNNWYMEKPSGSPSKKMEDSPLPSRVYSVRREPVSPWKLNSSRRNACWWDSTLAAWSVLCWSIQSFWNWPPSW